MTQIHSMSAIATWNSLKEHCIFFTQLTVILQVLNGTYNEQTEMMMVDGMSCPRGALHCKDPQKGTYVWEDREATCSRTHSEIYHGQASLHKSQNNESTIAMISNDDLESYAGMQLC